jgi:hypothetical protein
MKLLAETLSFVFFNTLLILYNFNYSFNKRFRRDG